MPTHDILNSQSPTSGESHLLPVFSQISGFREKLQAAPSKLNTQKVSPPDGGEDGEVRTLLQLGSPRNDLGPLSRGAHTRTMQNEGGSEVSVASTVRTHRVLPQ